jgi:RHS repeat-associated protein
LQLVFFDNLLSCGGSAVFNYPFLTQKERDTETGLDFFGARYYGSTQGRFTSVDPVTVTPERFYDPQQFNLYAYTRNNPLRFNDPTGKTLTISGDLDEVKKQLAQMLGTDDAAKRIKFDEKTNTITVDLTGIDLTKNEGAQLLSDVISSNKVYDVKIGTSVDTKGVESSHWCLNSKMAEFRTIRWRISTTIPM